MQWFRRRRVASYDEFSESVSRLGFRRAGRWAERSAAVQIQTVPVFAVVLEFLILRLNQFPRLPRLR